ncbi:MAG: hypothetical protein HYZ53_21560 [Planctomycetes bacterium]|nr:hypothetical protein [Planctomycetota bacterium]
MLTFEIWVDARERPRKCTVAPLAVRPDVRLRRYHPDDPILVQAGHLLHPLGAPLDEFAATPAGRTLTTLALLDTTWRRVPGVLTRLRVATPPLLLSIPKGFVSVYPRRNPDGLDPEDGLASVEAIFVAAACLGVDDETWLDRYHWKEEFLRTNRERLAALRASVSARG